MTSMTKPCSRCKGKGFSYVKDYFDPTDVVPEDCELCDGTGKVRDIIHQGDGSFSVTLSDGRCVKCLSSMNDNSKCDVCGLRYNNG